MILPRHTTFHTRFISWYTRVKIKRHFSRVVIHGDFVDDGKAMLVVGNHFSWWDGFFVYYLNDRLFHRRFHVMMLEEQLKKNMLLNKVGAFSVQKNSRSLVESLGVARDILTSGQQNLLLYYPQGEIETMHKDQLVFQRGLEKVVQGNESRISIWMLVVLTDYFSEQKPELHLYLREYCLNGPFDIKALEAAFNAFLTDSKRQQKPGS